MIFKAADGSPFLLQLYCDAAWRMSAGSEISEHDAKAGIAQSSARLAETQWLASTPLERRLIVDLMDRSLADLDSAQNYAEHRGVGRAKLGATLASLRDRGVLSAQGQVQLRNASRLREITSGSNAALDQ